MNDFLSCSYASVCSGCDWLQKPLTEQRALKEEALRNAWRTAMPEGPELPDPKWVPIDRGQLRDRVDLMVDTRSGTYRVGLFDKFRTGLVDLQGCPQLSPKLENWLRDFRRIQLPIQRGSIRLRVAPDGTRGIWLDLANIDVKNLLDERTTLERLRELAIVEIGQRRKRLVERDGKLKLDDPILEPWFETYRDSDQGVQAVPLYCTIGTFTQPGFRANRALVETVLKILRQWKPKLVAEFGSGIGNFTLPLASSCEQVHAYEIDKLALQGLERSATEQGLRDRIEIRSGNFQAERPDEVPLAGLDMILVDPPRSGLMGFLKPLEITAPELRPKQFLYVSCFAESFATDSARLVQMGYEIDGLQFVDQFPQSRHFEIIAAFSRK